MRRCKIHILVAAQPAQARVFHLVFRHKWLHLFPLAQAVRPLAVPGKRVSGCSEEPEITILTFADVCLAESSSGCCPAHPSFVNTTEGRQVAGLNGAFLNLKYLIEPPALKLHNLLLYKQQKN